MKSAANACAIGDIVVGYGGWQDFALFDASDRQVLKVDTSLPISTALGVGEGRQDSLPRGCLGGPADPDLDRV